MARTTTTTVATTAVPILAAPGADSIGGGVTVIVNTGAAQVFVGGKDVTTSGANVGIPLAASGGTLNLASAEGVSALFAVCATSSTVTVLQV